MSAPLVALDDVNAWLEIEPGNAASDQIMLRLIAAASGEIERLCDRHFAQQAYTHIFDGNGHERLALREYPVASVQSVCIDGKYIPAWTPGVSNGWLLDRNSLVLRGYCFRRGEANVQVAYTAGYYVIPDELAQAAIELVAYRWRERSRIGMSSVTVQGQTTAFSQQDIPRSVRTALVPFTRVLPA